MCVEEHGDKAVNDTDSSQWLSPFSVGKTFLENALTFVIAGPKKSPISMSGSF